MWSTIVLTGGYESRDDHDELALYVTRQPIAPVALYFSLLATQRIRAVAPRFALDDCDPPAVDEVEPLAGMAMLEADPCGMERAA